MGGVGGHGLDPLFERGVYNLALLLAAAVMLARGLTVVRERGAWIALGPALLSWTAGNTVYAFVLAPHEPAPVPSVADAGWLGAYPLAYVGILLLVRARVTGLRRGLWLDGVIGALAVGAVCAAVVVPTLVGDAMAGSVAEVATNIAYPIGDLVMLGVITFALAVTGRAGSRTWILLAGGFLLFALADSLYSGRSPTTATPTAA